jgi:hypothetical protein
VVTDALRKVALESETVTITVVPVIYAASDERDRKDCFHFKNLTLLLRSSHGLLEGPFPESQPAGPVQAQAAAVAETPPELKLARRKRRQA